MNRILTFARGLWGIPWTVVFAAGQGLTILALLACGLTREAKRRASRFWDMS